MKCRKCERVPNVLNRSGGPGGTDTAEAVRKHCRNRDRVLIVTDERAAWSRHGDAAAGIPRDVPVRTWNLAGCRAGHAPSGKAGQHAARGPTDSAFRTVLLLEAGRGATRPQFR
ncbi:hypothetical protein ACFPK5_32240 [Streptomyces beijiangensis]|uniref:hypothetical protein n=1 Tax=Streptomyces beijiangensis TaxID=163361 RepID=UPI00337352D6